MIRKIAMSIVTVFRKTRSTIATFVLRKRAKRCGQYVGAARMPHIGSGVTLEIGSHAGFNGFTATGWGG